MKKYIILITISLILLSSSFNTKSCPIMGGDFSWICVGQDSFLITFTFFYDCNSCGISGSTIPIKCATTGSSITTLSIDKPTPIDITATCASNCTRCETSACSFPYGIQQYSYTKLLVLSSAGSCCKIKMYSAMCCRNATITTGAANENFYVEAELDRCVSPCDNSPTLSNPPLIIISKDQNFFYNPGAYDPDTNTSGGLLDSISYEWSSPLKGAGSPISYSSPYAYNKPIYFWGFPDASLSYPKGFHLNPLNGDISFQPVKVQQTVMVLKVKEWREINGVMTNIGFLTRDIHVIVISNVSNNVSPTMSSATYKEVCAGETVNFTISTADNNSNDTLNINWNCQIPGASWSDNNGSVRHPTGNFSWTPNSNHVSPYVYSFTVTVQDDACPLNGRCTQAFQILVKTNPEASFSVSDSGCGNYYFNAQTSKGIQPSFQWNAAFFPTSAANGSAVSANILHAGQFPYSLTVTENGCSNSYFDTIFSIDSFLYSTSYKSIEDCFGDSVQLQAVYVNNIGPLSYNWITGDSTQSINYIISKDKLITVEITDSAGCKTTDSFFINMLILPLVDLGMDRTICSNSTEVLPVTYSLDNAVLKDIRWYDQFNNLIKSGLDSSLAVHDSGIWQCIVEDSMGCKNTDEIAVFVNPVLVAFAPYSTICVGDTAVLMAYSTGSQTSSVKYSWYNLKSGLVTGLKQTIKVSPDTTTNYLLVVEETLAGTTCMDSFDVTVQVNPLPTIQWQTPIESCINGSILNLNTYINTTPSNATKTWTSPSDGLLAAYPGDKFNPILAGAGSHKVVIEAEDPTTGCINKDSSHVVIHALPQPNAGLDAEICTGDSLYLLDGQPDIPAGYWRSLSGIGIVNIAGDYYFNPNANGILYRVSYQLAYVYTDSNGCEDEDTVGITVYKTPVVNGGPDREVRVDTGLIELKGVPVGGIWSGSGVSGDKFDPASVGIGSYLLTYSYTNIICKEEDTIRIKVLKANGLNEYSAKNLIVYPNPTSNEIFISFDNGNELIRSVSIYNIEGKMQAYHSFNPKAELHLTDITYPSGLYYLKVECLSGEIYYHKIIINN